MRINRDMLLKIANDTVSKYVGTDPTLLAIYLQGSLLGESPLIGNTADIDLFFIHTDEVGIEREIIRVSDEVHLDISHHPHKLYRQLRELRVHPWLGPAVYSCKIMYDPQHFVDFVQASVRGQFSSVENVLSRVRKQARHAREMWESFYTQPHPPDPQEASLYLHALEHAANAVAGLSGQNLTERRFLLDLPAMAEAVNKTGLYAGFLGLLGAPAVEVETMRSWLTDWKNAYVALPTSGTPIRLHPHRWLYYERAVEVILNSPKTHDALWPLWRTWTHAICVLPADSPHHSAWQKAGEQLGLLGAAFIERIAGLDAYLDMVEELVESWARENGG
ncbi:MAG: hypothetical protein A2030_04670 [Chloroflexi bacterium RBG_19FT_COMBO_50_10]|nr:MAG: hypothetical protein A2030_04670 [Chloroflexi bacterium RBG_19FT_COMBO_50_10]